MKAYDKRYSLAERAWDHKKLVQVRLKEVSRHRW